LLAVSKDGNLIGQIENASKEVLIEAIKNKTTAYYYLGNHKHNYEVIMETKQYWDTSFYSYLTLKEFNLTEEQYKEVLEIYNTLDLFK
jgi:uncharacterized membrane protein YcgQ (UPF0703/DUF1980 family)